MRTAGVSERGWWFIRTRWHATALCFLGALWAWMPPLRETPVFSVNPGFFLAVGALLGSSNLFYAASTRRLTTGKQRYKDLCRLLRIQILSDYLALSLLTYGLGGAETPVLVLFLPHIILITLFFPRSDSFLMAWAGIVFASLPILLEYLELVPAISIFHGMHKACDVGTSPETTASYILGIAAAFLLCWYLVSEITETLLLRERQLEQACQRLQQLDLEKTQVTLRATHELKAPFAAIKSYVYTLRDGYAGPLPDKARQIVERIGERCDLLMEKITEIIHLSNLRTTVPNRTRLSDIDIVAAIRKEVEDASLIGRPRGIEISLQLDADVCVIPAIPESFACLLSNLLRNAVNYSHPRGRVEVTLENRSQDVVLRIQDQGIGIPEAHLSEIFEEHFRSSNAVRFNPNSSGMGLALVREIVRLHNGDIQVSSRLDAGSCFSVTLPKFLTGGVTHGNHPDR
ncbi:MAG: sensor histidine kinase [Alphaproteobacteria bacterium]